MAGKKAGTCKVCGENPGECLVGPYDEINKECNKAGGEAHHIVPDYTLRTGTRKDARKGLNRIKPKTGKATSLKKGTSICLSKDSHKGLHKKLDNDIKALGANNKPPGQAPMNNITKASINSINNIKSLDSKCKADAEKAVDEDMMKYRNTPGRTTKSLPKDNAKGNTLSYLKNGGK